jgi:hypothetical protein
MTPHPVFGAAFFVARTRCAKGLRVKAATDKEGGFHGSRESLRHLSEEMRARVLLDDVPRSRCGVDSAAAECERGAEVSAPMRLIKARMTITEVGQMDGGKPGAEVKLSVHPANAVALAKLLYKTVLVEIAVGDEVKP